MARISEPKIDDHVFRSELRKEGTTMSLYIAIALLAALLAVSDTNGRNVAGPLPEARSPSRAPQTVSAELMSAWI